MHGVHGSRAAGPYGVVPSCIPGRRRPIRARQASCCGVRYAIRRRSQVPALMVLTPPASPRPSRGSGRPVPGQLHEEVDQGQAPDPIEERAPLTSNTTGAPSRISMQRRAGVLDSPGVPEVDEPGLRAALGPKDPDADDDSRRERPAVIER